MDITIDLNDPLIQAFLRVVGGARVGFRDAAAEQMVLDAIVENKHMWPIIEDLAQWGTKPFDLDAHRTTAESLLEARQKRESVDK